MKSIKLRCIFVFLLSITFKQARTAVEISSPEEHVKPTSVLEGWQKFETKVKHLTNSGLKQLAPLILNESLNLSDGCMENIKHLIAGMEEIKPWAMKFVDSSGKFFDGVLVGAFTSFGSYDECLDIEVKNRDFGEQLLFQGQYCSIMIIPPLPPKPIYVDMIKVPDELKNFSMRDTAVAELAKHIRRFYVTPLRWGVCVPSGCSIHDVNKMTPLLSRELSLDVIASRCEIKETTTFTLSAIFVIIFYCFIVILLLLGSSIDFYYRHSKADCKSTEIQILLAFSIFNNFKRLTSPAPKSNNFNFLYGIRFLGILWIVFGHGTALISFGTTDGLKYVEDGMQTFSAQVYMNGSFCVETFFCIGGMLVCYGAFQKLNHPDKKFNILMYIIHRIWRIIPSYLFVILAVFIMPMLGSSPIWHDLLDPTLESCQKNWWAHMLFIQNFYDTNSPCFVHFWYVAVDFQLYIFALVILLPMLKWPKIGLSLAVVTIIASICYAAIVTYINELPPTLLFTVLDVPTVLHLCFQRYFKPFIHAGPYAIGLLVGYLLSSKPKIKIPPFMMVMGWLLACVLSLSVTHGTLPWYIGANTSLASIIAYAALSRTVWTVSVAWMIFCCATGNGGIIDSILSTRAFVPLGRISYLAYLIHFPLQYFFVGSLRIRTPSTVTFTIWIFCGHVVMTYAFAFVVNMLIEAPFTNLEKVFFFKQEKDEECSKKTKDQDIFTMDVKTENEEDITEQMGDRTEKNGDIPPILPVHV